MNSIKFENIFEVVTNNKSRANDLQTRAELIILIRDILKDKGWNRLNTTKNLLLTQIGVQDLLNGEIDKFSTDQLMACIQCPTKEMP